MKVLYYGVHQYPDCMSDVIFHGLRSILGADLVDVPHVPHMYIGTTPKDVHGHHGQGFSISSRLDNTLIIDRTDISAKIKAHYFDLIVYGSIQRLDHISYGKEIELVQKYYTPNEIILIDGSDYCPGNVSIFWESIRGIKFIRENRDAKYDPTAHNICVAIPKENIVDEIPSKKKNLMSVIPGLYSTYKYDATQEKDYFQDFQESFFGLTWKRAGGWEAMRHYEILSQGCMPLFLDINHVPSTMMLTYPKQQASNFLDIAVKIAGYRKDMKFEYVDSDTGHMISVIGNVAWDHIEFNDPDSYGYYELANEMLQFTKEYLTTEYQAKRILDIVKTFT